MNKKIIIAITSVVVVTGLLYGGLLFTNKRTDTFAKSQLTYLVDADYTTIYKNLSSESKKLYKDEDDFTEKFSNGITFEEIAKTDLKATSTSKAGKNYTYELTRKDDPLKGYTVVVTLDSSPIKNQIKDILYQEEDFAAVSTE